MKNSISIVVPVYNEEKTIRKAIETLYQFLKNHYEDFEIIIIESGSSDCTSQIADSLKNHGDIKVFHEKKKNGFGSALRLGYSLSSKNFVCLVTTDFPFNLESINQGMEIINNYNCVLSYRSVDNRSAFRRFQSVIYNYLVKITLGLTVKHVNSAFKLFKTQLIQSLPLCENGWLIDAEIIYYLQERKQNWVEIPVPLVEYPGRKSSTSIFSFFTLIIDLLKFKRKLRSEAQNRK